MNAFYAPAGAFLGICVTGLVAWRLAAIKARTDAANDEAEVDSLSVGTADKLVTLLRADMLDVRAQMVVLRAEVNALHVHVQTCEADNLTLRMQVASLRAENDGLRARVGHLESELGRRDGDGR